MKNLNKTKMINFRLDLELINKFQELCKKEGYSVSKRIRILIERDLKGDK